MTSPFMYIFSEEKSYMEFAKKNNIFVNIPGVKYLPEVTWSDVAEGFYNVNEAFFNSNFAQASGNFISETANSLKIFAVETLKEIPSAIMGSDENFNAQAVNHNFSGTSSLSFSKEMTTFEGDYSITGQVLSTNIGQVTANAINSVIEFTEATLKEIPNAILGSAESFDAQAVNHNFSGTNYESFTSQPAVALDFYFTADIASNL
jgi:hypothetical protein